MKCHVHEIHGCRGGKKTPTLTHASSGSSYNGLASGVGANLKYWTQEKIDHPGALSLLSSSAGCPGPFGCPKEHTTGVFVMPYLVSHVAMALCHCDWINGVGYKTG